MNKFRRSLISILAKTSKYQHLFGKLDINFKNNQFNSIGTTDFSMGANRGLVFSNDNLVLSGQGYFQVNVTNQFTNESTIQILVEATPSNNVINNWFRFATTSGDLVFGYMTEEVLNAQKPFVLTYLFSSTQPTVKTYINDSLIFESSPARNLWRTLQVGAGFTSPQPTGLTIKRFRIFDTRINDSDVNYYCNEMLENS